MRALDYVVGIAQEWRMPVAVNLSFGNTYGSHDGTSLLETYLHSMAERGRTSIIVGTGNEGYSMDTGRDFCRWTSGGDRACSGGISDGLRCAAMEIVSGPVFSRKFSAGRQQHRGDPGIIGSTALSYETEEILLYYGMPSPYSQAQEIYLDLIPKGSYIQDGLWKIRLIPEEIRDGQYDLWLQGHGTEQGNTFFGGIADTTLTIPSTASRAISVGAYDDATQAYADFSGRGFARLGHPIKPELAAPGVNIITARAGGGYEASDRNFLCRSICDRIGGSDDAMGDCKWERSLSVWGEAESISHPRGAESAGGDGISE